jgi:hypothetical protein
VVADDPIDIPADLPVPLKPHRRRRAQLIWSAVQLICGVVIGVGATLYVLKDHIMWSRLQGPNPVDVRMIVGDMQRRYNLTDEQFKRVSQLVDGSWTKRKEMGKTFFGQMSAEDTRVKSEMEAILTPDQFKAYTEDMKRMAERHERRRPPFFREGGREGGPGGPGGPGGGPGPGPGGRGPRRPRDGEGEGFTPNQRPRGDTEGQGFGPGPGPRPRGDNDPRGPRPPRPIPDQNALPPQPPLPPPPTDPNTLT